MMEREYRIAKRYLMGDEIGWFMRHWQAEQLKAEAEKEAEEQVPLPEWAMNEDEYEVPF